MRTKNPVPAKSALLPPVALRPIAFCVAALLASGGASALSLGNVRGAVLIGRPVNVTVPVTFDPGETGSSTCTEVDISFADARLDSSRVRTSWTTPDAKGESSLRIQSTVPVDEPMINIWLRAGCARKYERRYVLLADVVSEPTPAAPASAGSFSNSLPVVVSTPPVVVAAPAPAGGTDTNNLAASQSKPANVQPVAAARKPRKPRKAPVASEVVPKPAATKPTQEAAPVSSAAAATPVPVEDLAKPAEPKPVASAPKATAPVAKAKSVEQASPPPPAKAHLRLESLPDAAPTGLKASFSLGALPVENSPARDAARATWRALNAGSEELIGDANRRIQALEAEAKLLKDSKAKVQADQDALKAQLEKAEEDRYSNWLVGLLGALLLGASALAGFLWWRSRNQTGWSPKDLWHGHSIEPSNLSDLAPADSGLSGAAELSKPGLFSRRKAAQPDVDLDVDESLFDSLKTSGMQSMAPSSRMDSAPPTNGRGFVHSMSTRTVNVEELFDIQQQAEFFVSLGQNDQAIELLRQHIYTNTSTSGIAFLDLLKIYHDLGRRSEYEQLREEFNESFNAKVPPFDAFGEQQRRGLERYPSAIARIEALWKSPRILSVLQETIFRRPEAGDAENFDLEAYRELLLLFSIAKEVSGPSSGVTTMGHKPQQANYADSQSPPPIDLDDVTPPAPPPPPEVAPVKKPRASRARSFENSVSVNTGDSEIPVPKASPRLGLDVNLFELESSFDPVAANQPGPELGMATAEDRAAVALQAAASNTINTISGGLNDRGAASSSPLPPLDFSLSLPAEFSTAAPPPPLISKIVRPEAAGSSASALAMDLNKYMAKKDQKSADL